MIKSSLLRPQLSQTSRPELALIGKRELAAQERVRASGKEGTKFDGWRPAIEHVVLTALQNGVGCLGVLGVQPGDGASSVAAVIADAVGESGYRCLLVDLSAPAEAMGTPSNWSPSDGDPFAAISIDDCSRERLSARPSVASKLRFHDTCALRKLFNETLSGYGSIIVDLAAVFDRNPRCINPLAAAAACDAVVLICTRGRTTPTNLAQAIAIGEAAHVKFAGVVINDNGYVSPGVEIARKVRRALWFLPPLARRLERRILQAEFLQ